MSVTPGLISEAVQLELGAGEPWPADAQLFEPLEVEQVLLPDRASCLAVQAFLHMCQLPFSVEMRANAEQMSPGRLPFVRAGKFVVAELDNIVNFVTNKGVALSGHLDAAQKADMRAYMSLVANVLGNAEAHVSWIDEETLNTVTRPRYGSVYPWPLNWLLTRIKRNQVMKKLSALGWTKKSLQDVYNEVENCCQALSERLDNQRYFFNNKPTELDALVFGHLFTILTTPMPDNGRMASIVKSHSNLVELCSFIDREYFDRSSSDGSNFETL